MKHTNDHRHAIQKPTQRKHVKNTILIQINTEKTPNNEYLDT
jgi:hypothetical protein